MIDPTTPCFPNNVVAVLADVLSAVDEDVVPLTRPLRPTDPNMSLSVYASVWLPDDSSFEIGKMAPEPTLGNYGVQIQTLTKHGDSPTALAVSSIFTKRVRNVLYRNEPLHVILGSLSVDEDDRKESMRRWGVRSQRYLSNEVQGTYLFVSVLDIFIETETR